MRLDRLLGITFALLTGSHSERKAEPYNLLWEKGIWYLDAYCLLRRAKRYLAHWILQQDLAFVC
ncbi:hypothetical protein DUZ99_11290 [Xylanibacillus composti]|uniref:WYL domain-containing protein n=1 Tax=Xylanibacillus composti TaxID=1572762 RepID=A0A8J4GYT6_9BACL|nr:hypothetical protein [Xylanibacillus composti]GIQ67649.1 hypothetical protein XYCOK13_04730 [Xylanibacillus composti]